ncbi:MAG: substrate-binding domain-containing protein, partial [Eubacteriales bacterium]
KGFKNELSEKLSIFSVDNNDDRDEIAYSAAKRFLERSAKGIDGVYITGGGITGLITALKEQGVAKKVKVISHDITPAAVRYIKEGSLHFTLGQDPRFQGYKSVSILFDVLYRNIMPPARHIYTNIDIRMKTNI